MKKFFKFTGIVILTGLIVAYSVDHGYPLSVLQLYVSRY